MRRFRCCAGRRWALVLSLLWFSVGLVNAQNQTINPPRKWATSMGGVNFDFIADAVGDGAGGLYVTGYTNSPNFPTTLAGSPGAGYDVFVARLDSLGGVLWSTRYGGNGDDFGYAIARDGSGNLYIAGKLGDQGGFLTDSLYKAGGGDILVLKFNGNGGYLAGTRYGGSAAEEAVGIASDASGNLIVVGNSSSSDIPTTIATYNGTSGDAFILRLRSNLTRHWAMRYGGNSFDKANDAAIDANGNVYVAGETGSANFQQTLTTYQGSGGAKAFILRLDSLGARNWAQRYGGSGVERAYALDIPANGGLLVAGYTTSTNFPQTISGLSGAGLDAFLLHLNLDGTRDYARRLGGTLDDLAIDLASDATGHIFIAGETQSSNFPSTNSAYKSTNRDQFLAKFEPNGGFAWAIPYGGSANDFAGGSVTATGRAVYLAGHTQSLNFPQTMLGTGGNTSRGSVIRFKDCIGQDADFSFSDVCEFDTVRFTNLSVRGSSDTVAYRWWFGDGDSSDVVTPWHYYPTPGAYQVRLRLTSPCGVDSFMVKTVHVYPRPRTNWTYTLPCATRATQFMDSTALDTVLGSFENGWSWTFGNGATSLAQNPTYVYPGAGTFNVLLTVETNHGCTDTESKIVRVHHRPDAGFQVADICLWDTAMFADTSSIGGDSLAVWHWDFGVNGGTASVQNPTFVYPFADTLTVQLVVESNEGCTDTTTGPIIVRPLPMVDFGMTSVCWPDSVAFTDSTTIAGDLINGYEWHFGDATMNSQQHSSHAYAASGDYDVVLWVTTASGCADSALQTLHVNDKPLAQFAATPVCYPAGTAFADQSTVQADSLVAWHWDFGDGGLDSLAGPSHTYAAADTYAVSLAVVSAFGCRDTTWQDVIVLPKPVAAFNPPSACYPLPLTFVDGSGVIGDNITGSDWDFGDGNTASGFLALHQYANAGSYLVTLVTETSSGCKDTLQDSAYLYARPTAAFTVQSVCDGDTASFVDGSSVSSGSIAQHLYSFGDGNTSNATDPDWVYGGPGTYLASLTVTSDHNCIATALQTLVIHALPDPAPMVAGYNDICIGDTAHLQELQSFQHYAWETGDTTDAILVFGRTDWVVLTVVDSNQCIGSDSVAVRYHNVPRPNAVVTPGPDIQACANDSLVLTAGGSYSSYLWSDGQTTETHLVTQSGAISVLVFNGFGCADTSDIATITLLPAPAVPTITQVGPVLTASAATAYQWYFNQLAIPGATGQSLTATATGDYAVRVTNAAGCSTFSTTRSLIVAAAQPLVHDLRIYPNPFADALHLQGLLQQGGTLHVRLLNVTGQEVLTQTQTVAAGQLQLDLDTAKLPAGYYLCELRIGARVIVRAVARQ